MTSEPLLNVYYSLPALKTDQKHNLALKHDPFLYLTTHEHEQSSIYWIK